jgi:hypothetical protein
MMEIRDVANRFRSVPRERLPTTSVAKAAGNPKARQKLKRMAVRVR